MFKKISKKYRTGYFACIRWHGNLESAKEWYKSKKHNITENFLKGWYMAFGLRSVK